MIVLKAIVWGLIAVILYPVIDKLFIKGKHESEWTTENGEYKIYIERMRTFGSPFMQAKITDPKRNKMYSKRIKDPALVQEFDTGKRDEVVYELVKRYEVQILKLNTC